MNKQTPNVWKSDFGTGCKCGVSASEPVTPVVSSALPGTLTVARLRSILAKLPDDMDVRVVRDGLEEMATFVSVIGDSLMLCDNAESMVGGETVLFDKYGRFI